MRWPAWIHDALRLGPKEVDRVRPGLPTDDLRLLASVSEQSDEALELLIQRLRHPKTAVRHSPLIWLAPAAFAVATVLIITQFGLGDTQTMYGEIPVALNEPASMSQLQTLDLGPSIRVSGLGELTVEQADERGTQVRLHRGSARFDIDPSGAHRALTVFAADTAIRVTGTQFVVHRLYDSVHIDVLRGSVEIERDGALSVLTAGDSWTHRGVVAALTVVPKVRPGIATIASVPPPERFPSLSPVDGVAQTPPSAPVHMTVPVQGTGVAELPEQPVAPTSGESFAQILDALDGSEPPASIARALDAFLRQHPTSSMAPEAAALRLEVAAELEPPRIVVADLDVWLRANLEHPRRLALLELQATLARDHLQDCALALPPYRALAIEATVTQAARAEALRGLCALEIGDRDEARTALARAVELGVDATLAADVTAAQAVLKQP
jgi:hypothetical protein